MNTRRLILFLAFILFVIAAAIAIYFVFFKPAKPTPSPGNQNVNGGTLPGTNGNANRITANTNGGIPTINGANVNVSANVNASPIADGGVTAVTPIINGTVVEPMLNGQSNKLMWYDPTTQKFYESADGGKTFREMSDQLFPNAQSIVWSNQGNKAAITFPDNSKILYDFATKKQYSLPKDADNFSFSPAGDQIAYKYLPSDVNDRYIVTANPDGSGIKFVESIGDKAADVNVSWSPKGDVVATFRKSVDSTKQEIFFIGQNKENFKSAVTEGRGFAGQWSPTGSQMVYSVYSADTNYNPSLYIVSASGDTIGAGRTNLDLQTWPDKCAFTSSGATMYCAAPKFLEPGSGLHPADISSNDDFYAIDVYTGNKRLLATPASLVNAQNLFVSTNGKDIYFTNKYTGRLESIKLP